MNGSLWIQLAVFLLIHSLPSSIESEDLGLYSASPSSSRRLLAQESSQVAASPPSTIDCSNSGSMACMSDSRIAARTNNILPHSKTLTIAVVVIFVACIVMGFFSVYARRFCIREGNLNINYQSVERGGNVQAVVGSLPIVQYGGAAAPEEGQLEEKAIRKNMRECAVCISEFEEGDALRLLPACGHLFHKDCIDMWLFSHTTCPLCRLSLLTKPKRGSSNSPSPRALPHAVDLQPMLAPPVVDLLPPPTATSSA